MEELELAKITNTIREIQNQLEKVFPDIAVSKVLMARSINQLQLLLTHIGYLESKLESVIAENQRLTQISRY